MQCGTVRHTGTGSGHACLHASCAPDRVATPVKRHGLAAVTHHLGVHKLSSGRKLKPGGVDVRRRAKRSRHIVACLNDEASLQLVRPFAQFFCFSLVDRRLTPTGAFPFAWLRVHAPAQSPVKSPT